MLPANGVLAPGARIEQATPEVPPVPAAHGLYSWADSELKLPPISSRSQHIDEAGRRREIQSTALVVREEKQLILDDGTAESSAKHVPAQFRCRQNSSRSVSLQAVLPLIGVENVVAEEFKCVAMILVRARFDRRIDDSTVVVAEFRGGVLGNDIDFGDSVGGGCETQKIVGGLIVVNPIQQEIVRLLAVAVDVRPAAFFGGIGSEVHAMSIDRDRTRRQEGQLHIVACGQGKVIAGPGIDNCPDLSGLTL